MWVKKGKSMPILILFSLKNKGAILIKNYGTKKPPKAKIRLSYF